VPSSTWWQVKSGCRLAAASSTKAIAVSDDGIAVIAICAKRPTISQRSQRGAVTLTITGDARFAGLSFYIFRRSGMTGQVVPLGTTRLDNSGVGTRSFTSTAGQHLLLYGKLIGATQIESPYSHDLAFVVN